MFVQSVKKTTTISKELLISYPDSDFLNLQFPYCKSLRNSLMVSKESLTVSKELLIAYPDSDFLNLHFPYCKSVRNSHMVSKGFFTVSKEVTDHFGQ